jgi:hypothetical protein
MCMDRNHTFHMMWAPIYCPDWKQQTLSSDQAINRPVQRQASQSSTMLALGPPDESLRKIDTTSLSQSLVPIRTHETALKALVDGEWTGHFTYYDAAARRANPVAKIEQSGFKLLLFITSENKLLLSGDGQDVNGTYQLSGEMSQIDDSFVMRKRYTKHTILWNGRFDRAAETMIGTWSWASSTAGGEIAFKKTPAGQFSRTLTLSPT